MKDEITQKVFVGVAIAVAVLILGAAVIWANWMKGSVGTENVWVCENGAWAARGEPADPMPLTGCGTQTVLEREEYQGIITEADNNRIKIQISANEEVEFALTDESEIYNSGGDSADKSYLRKGFSVTVNAIIGVDNEIIARRVRITAEPNITVTTPKPGDIIGMPVRITGEARVFENSFTYRVKDAEGRILIEKSAMTNAQDAGQFGFYEINTNYAVPKTENGFIEVFEYSPKDGAEINMVSVPVKFGKIETTKINVFFGNSKLDPNATDCGRVFAATKDIPKTDTPGRAALEELLAGPTAEEQKNGYFSSINSGVQIQKLSIENGAAKVDFNKQLEEAVGGSCRVAAIRAQITQTLKQFPTVKSVVISIDGRTEDILQP